MPPVHVDGGLPAVGEPAAHDVDLVPLRHLDAPGEPPEVLACGALVMVEELLAHEGAAQDTDIFQFASHVDADQRIEIARMRRMLAELPQPHHE